MALVPIDVSFSYQEVGLLVSEGARVLLQFLLSLAQLLGEVVLLRQLVLFDQVIR